MAGPHVSELNVHWSVRPALLLSSHKWTKTKTSKYSVMLQDSPAHCLLTSSDTTNTINTVRVHTYW